MLIPFLKVIQYVEMETPISHGQNYQVRLWHNIIFTQAVESEKKPQQKPNSHTFRGMKDVFQAS